MAKTISPKKIGVYGPVGSGKSLFISRWIDPDIKMNQDDLDGNPFTNLYVTTEADLNGNLLIEHPFDDKVDPTEDFFVIIATKVGWNKMFQQACSISSDRTFLVFTWKDKASSGVFSSKINERHDDVSSYTGAGFTQFMNKILANRTNKRRKKTVKKKEDNDGWITAK